MLKIGLKRNHFVRFEVHLLAKRNKCIILNMVLATAAKVTTEFKVRFSASFFLSFFLSFFIWFFVPFFLSFCHSFFLFFLSFFRFFLSLCCLFIHPLFICSFLPSSFLGHLFTYYFKFSWGWNIREHIIHIATTLQCTCTCNLKSNGWLVS